MSSGTWNKKLARFIMTNQPRSVSRTFLFTVQSVLSVHYNRVVCYVISCTIKQYNNTDRTSVLNCTAYSRAQTAIQSVQSEVGVTVCVRQTASRRRQCCCDCKRPRLRVHFSDLFRPLFGCSAPNLTAPRCTTRCKTCCFFFALICVFPMSRTPLSCVTLLTSLSSTAHYSQ